MIYLYLSDCGTLSIMFLLTDSDMKQNEESFCHVCVVLGEWLWNYSYSWD